MGRCVYIKHLSMGWSPISSITNGTRVARWAIASMAIQNYTLGRCDEKAPPDESQIGPCRAPRPRVGAPSRPESRRYTPLVDTSDEFTEFRIVIRVRPFFSARSEGQERRAGRCGALCLMTYLKHHARISDGDCSPWRIVEALCASRP
jgi:hypothetical protein